MGVEVADREGIDLMLVGIESPSAGVALSNLRCATSDSSSPSFTTSLEDIIDVMCSSRSQLWVALVEEVWWSKVNRSGW